MNVNDNPHGRPRDDQVPVNDTLPSTDKLITSIDGVHPVRVGARVMVEAEETANDKGGPRGAAFLRSQIRDSRERDEGIPRPLSVSELTPVMAKG